MGSCLGFQKKHINMDNETNDDNEHIVIKEVINDKVNITYRIPRNSDSRLISEIIYSLEKKYTDTDIKTITPTITESNVLEEKESISGFGEKEDEDSIMQFIRNVEEKEKDTEEENIEI